ncbi:MAG: DUF1361 domain-containing protein [Anaerolineales bacterium]|nr:DUF1361 domain-containing protein [Anaerolineales bacterium]
MDILYRLHRFLVSQLIYPIVLSSALAMAVYVVRVLVSNTYVVYANLVWNLLLAWMPYLFSVLAAALYRLFPRRWWLLIVPSAIWLAFFPNAPYIITDFFHLAQRPGIPLWYDMLLLTTFSWTGIFLAVASLRTMQVLAKAYLGTLLSWVFVAFSLGLGGLGIYLGRFERWNSWDLLSHPRSILADVALRIVSPFENVRFFSFTILVSAFLLVCYLMFISVRHAAEADEWLERSDSRNPGSRSG